MSFNCFYAMLMAVGFVTSLIEAKEEIKKEDELSKQYADTCKDVASVKQCSFWKQNGACITHSNRLHRLCQKTCGFCGKEVCTDLGSSQRCTFMRINGACHTHRHFMRKVCARTCQLCDLNSKCEYKICPAGKYCNANKKGEIYCDCNRHCERRYQYKKLGSVCSSDGRTFADYCKMKHTACREGLELTVKHYGACPVAVRCQDASAETKSGLCKTWKRAKACSLYRDTMFQYCAKTCDLCHLHRAAAPPLTCADTEFGCCWDGSAAKGAGLKGCRDCKDTYPNTCLTFMSDCNSTMKKNKAFMKQHCPATCQFCVPLKGTPGKERANVNRFISIIRSSST